MIKIVDGSLLDATEDILCHQVNCQGVMGSGIAFSLRNKYEYLFHAYRSFCRAATIDKTTDIILGRVYYVVCEDNHIIANIFGQDTYGRGNIVYTDYNALETGLTQVRDFATEKGLTVAMPYKMGCGSANGDWDTVYKIIEKVFSNMNVTLYKI